MNLANESYKNRPYLYFRLSRRTDRNLATIVKIASLGSSEVNRPEDDL